MYDHKSLLGGSSQLVSGLVHPCYKWTLPHLQTGLYPKWNEQPSNHHSSFIFNQGS